MKRRNTSMARRQAASRFRVLAVSSVVIVLELLVLPCSTWARSQQTVVAFAAPKRKTTFLDTIANANPFFVAPQEPEIEQPSSKDILDSLDLKSNTEPKPFSAEPSQIPSLISAALPILLRGGSGLFVEGYRLSIVPKDTSQYSVLTVGNFQLLESSSSIRGAQQPLILYDVENRADCRLIREALCILSLPVSIVPCPKGGTQERDQPNTKNYAPRPLPYLMDPNTGITLSKRNDMLRYLFTTYGTGQIPWTLGGQKDDDRSIPMWTARVGVVWGRGGAGGTARPSAPASQPLTLWTYESSPFCTLVRERLGELDIPYISISCPRGSPDRQRLFELTGRFQAPCLQDPNNGVTLFESKAICEYLETLYGIRPSPVKYL